jgi:alkanesulfonate monooxygenase SsuD/methylene tetrahydromethanopterin reductase-like flavin-dependent oxidoreductase (luciferase family)
VRFGIAPPNWGPSGDPRAAVELAVVAEQAGWDGYFSWDALIVASDPPPTYDPWTILSAVATATERIRIGTCIAVLARYKPHLVAPERSPAWMFYPTGG